MLLTLHKGEEKKYLLFDAGPDEELLRKNADLLKLDLSVIDAIVISHGHEDHYGGLFAALDACNQPDLPVHVHPEIYTKRAAQAKEGGMIESTGTISPELIKKHGGSPRESDEPITILDGFAMVSGEVPRITSYEQGVPRALRLIDGKWEHEPKVIDERLLILNLKGKGLCVLTGCGHIGAVNALHHVKELHPSKNLHMLIGGLHLAGPTYEKRIEDTISDLQQLDPDLIVSGHCTGRVAQSKLSQLFKERHIPYGVGAYFNIKAA